MPIGNSIFVHIIESPSRDDLLDGVTEGRTLSSFLELANIPCCYNLVTDEATLGKALQERLPGAAIKHNRIPIIHFSVHGNRNGIQLTINTFITWQHLGTMLTPINQILRDNLIVCLSACSSIAGSRMALTEASTLPINTLIATGGSPTWQEAAVAFVTFYHHIIGIGSDLEHAIAAMQVASSHMEFNHIIAANVQATFRQFLTLTQHDQQQVIESLRRIQSPS